MADIFEAQVKRVADGELRQIRITHEDCGEVVACDLMHAKLAAVYAFMRQQGMTGKAAKMLIRMRVQTFPED